MGKIAIQFVSLDFIDTWQQMLSDIQFSAQSFNQILTVLPLDKRAVINSEEKTVKNYIVEAYDKDHFPSLLRLALFIISLDLTVATPRKRTLLSRFQLVDSFLVQAPFDAGNPTQSGSCFCLLHYHVISSRRYDSNRVYRG
eukprot:IDg1130t1